MKSRAYCGALVATSLLAVSGVDAGTINVANLNDSGTGSLRQAIQDATAGDLILVDLAGTITLTSGTLVVGKNLLIEGPGARILTITRGGTTRFRILHVTSGSLYLSNVTLRNGDASSGAQGGGAVLVNPGAGCTIDYSTIANNFTGTLPGGGILNNGGSLTLRFDTIWGNQAGVGGGIENNGQAGPASAYLLESTIANNVASTTSAVIGGGGGIDNDHGTLTLDSCTIAENTGKTGNSTAGGGGVQNVSGSTANVTNTLISGNVTDQVGADVNGAFTSSGFNLIRVRNGSTGFTTLSTDQTGTAASPLNAFLGPLQNNGGQTDTRMPGASSPAIDKGRTSFHIDQRQRQAPYDDPNIANATGGDGSDIGAVERVNSQFFFVHNTKDFGTGSLREAIIQAGPGDAVIFDSSVAGTINLTSGVLTIDRGMSIVGPGARNVMVTNPTGTGFEISGTDPVVISGLTVGNCSGMGIFDDGNVIMSDSAIVNNQGSGFVVIQSSSSLTLTRSTISGNASVEGSGIDNGGMATLTNCTIANNTATYNNAGGGLGGGIYNTGTLSLTNCTVTGNAAVGNPNGSKGGGLLFQSGTAHLANTIVAGNTTDGSGPDIFGFGISDGSNLIRIGNGSNGFTNGVNHDQVGTGANPTNANLGPLRNNGGPSDTCALLSGSPALDAGNDSVLGPPLSLSTDQRGQPRKTGSAVDIGAFEFIALATPTPSPTPTATPTATPSGLVANVSTRLPVGTGDNVLIEGFIVQGPPGLTKKIIVRAIGPSLVPFGITEALANPTLEIHDSSGLIAMNDDWKVTQIGGLITGDQSAEIAASGVVPSNDLESAIIANLLPGSYTAVVRGLGNTVGTGVVDAYDLSATSAAKLANIATRGLIQPGDKLMIAGFIIQNGPVKAVVRAIGPSLVAFGINNALPDTTLQLRDQNGTIVVEDDDWKVRPDGSSQQAEVEATGLQPSNDLEAAFVITLQPGQYTAQVRGKPESTGIGVVQVYFLQ